MGSYIGYTLANMLQHRDRLEDRSIHNRMFRWMWEEIEKRKTNKAQMAEIEKERRERKTKKTNNRWGDSDSKNSRERVK